MTLYHVPLPQGGFTEFEAATVDEAKTRRDAILGTSPPPPPDTPVTAGGIANTVGAGVLHGAAIAATLPGNLLELTSRGLDWATGRDPSLRSHPLPTADDLNTAISRDVGRVPGSMGAQIFGEGAGGPVELHQPENPTERFLAPTVEGATAGGILGGPMGAAYGVLSGAASVTAGKVAHETLPPQFEKPIEFGAGLVGGVAAGPALTRLSRATPEAMIRRRLGTTTDADITAAETLVRQSQARGIPMTWPQALNQVTEGRVDLRALQSATENSPGGQPIMSEHLSRVGPAVRTAMGEEATAIRGGQAAGDPATRGLAVQAASGDLIRRMQLVKNRLTRADYRTAETEMLGDPAFTELMRDPLYRRQVEEIRNDDVYSRSVAGLPDRSVGMLDAVQKRLTDRAANLQGGEALLPYAAGQYQGTAARAVRAGQRASPEYARARATQAQFHEQILDPMEAGPPGAMRRIDDIQAQAKALLPPNPPAGSEVAVARTVRVLGRRNPELANDLVATGLETYFNDAIARTTSTPEAAGATAARGLIGNPQAERNLEAAVRALPDGNAKWQSLQVLLRVFQATGRRMGMGSPTEPRMRISEELGAGTLPGRMAETAVAGAATAVTGGGVPATLAGMRLLGDWWKQFSQGRRSANLARIITDPASAPLLRDLITARTFDERAQIAAQLIARGGVAAEVAPDNGVGGPVNVGAPAPGNR